MKKWSGKSKGSVLGYKIFIFVIKKNINYAYILLRFVTFFYYLFSPRKDIVFYYRKIHNYSWFKTQISIYKNYCLLGEMIIDKIAMSLGYKDKFTFEFEGENLLRDVAFRKCGALLVGAHMGNWNIAGQLLDRINTPINIVLVDAESKKIKEVIKKSINQNKINIIAIKNDFSHLLKIKDAFTRNEFIVMHGDRFTDESTSTIINFMGKDAKFPIGPMYLAMANEVPLIYVYVLKEGKRHYHFYAKEGFVSQNHGSRKEKRENMRKMVIYYASELEKIVNKYPLQWFNYYDFWEK